MWPWGESIPLYTPSTYASWAGRTWRRAVNLLGPKYGLPRALSGHVNYYLWGPGDSSWEVMIVITWYKGHYDTIFSDIQQVDSILTEASGPGINGMPVYICRKPGLPIKDIWAYLKTYQ